jgi:hypothetical protein
MKLPAWFWPWAAWMDSGKRGPRPPAAPKKIPLRIWARYAIHAASRKKLPPPPPPPPPRSPFESKGVLTAWGMTTGDLRAGAVVARARAAGYSYVLGQYTDGNEPYLAGLRDVCHAAGLTFGLWDATPTPNRTAALARFQPELVMLESEGEPTDWPAIIHELDTRLPNVPRAVITNFRGIDNPVLQAAGFVLVPECYLPDNPNATVPRMVATAKGVGYKTVVPCIGVYHGYPLANYMPLDVFCVYVAETMTDADWAAG